MATFRNQTTDSYALGSTPPEIRWTVVRGDSAAFRVYVTDVIVTGKQIGRAHV